MCMLAVGLNVLQAEHHRTSLEAARNTTTNLTEQIEQYAQKLKDVIIVLFLPIILTIIQSSFPIIPSRMNGIQSTLLHCVVGKGIHFFIELFRIYLNTKEYFRQYS